MIVWVEMRVWQQGEGRNQVIQLPLDFRDPERRSGASHGGKKELMLEGAQLENLWRYPGGDVQ